MCEWPTHAKVFFGVIIGEYIFSVSTFDAEYEL